MSIATIKAPVAEVNIQAYRGDTFNKLFLRIRDVEDGEQIPANISGSQFSLQIRPKPQASQLITTFDNSFFVLGLSNDAKDYFQENNLPSGSTLDEVHINVPAQDMRFEAGRYFYDLEFKLPDGEILTPIKGRFELIQDVTRDIIYP
jgi:hypothetical protein